MPEDEATISRILKVNHAGEYGAIRIYQAQIAIARWRAPGTVSFLKETLSHEMRHCRDFRAAMPERNSRPCRAMWLWGIGGLFLGGLTALCGAKGIWICTAAVEGTVHRHLNEQVHFLNGRDEVLERLIREIQEEENAHLCYAEERQAMLRPVGKIVRIAIICLTEVVIWLSTWGESSRLAKALNQN